MSTFKDTKINHHKLGEVTLGKIPNNEKCRMIVLLLQEQQQMKQQMSVMANLLQRMPKKKLETETKKLQAEIEEAQKKIKEAKEKEAKGGS